LVISLIPLLAAIILGVPIGIWLGHVHRGEFLAVSVTNIGRALPSLALIAILIGFVGIGMLNAMIALFLLAFPPILSYAFQAVVSIDRDLTRGARGMGMSPGQVLLKVELPLGVPMIIAGIRSEEHTSELQSRFDLVCRLLLEKKNKSSLMVDFASFNF